MSGAGGRRRTVNMVPCGCGCGTVIPDWAHGRPKRFVAGHQHRRPGSYAYDKDKTKAEIITCRCGCGATLLNRDGRGRPREFLPSHWSKIQPANKEPVLCLWCGTRALKTAYHRSKRSRHFCSRRCCGAYAAAHGLKRGAMNGSYNTVTVGCAGCGSSVSKAASLIFRRNNRVYCAACIPDHCRKGVAGFKTSGMNYPKEFNRSLKTRTRRRDGFICQVCGEAGRPGERLSVHHIDYDKTNLDPLNLISLCRKCHGKTNWAMDEWKSKLQAYQLARFSTTVMGKPGRLFQGRFSFPGELPGGPDEPPQ